MEHHVEGHGVTGTAIRNPTNGNVTVKGRVTVLGMQPQVIEWIAAAPVTRGIGFAGSGQPYPSRDIAMEGTPNKGKIESSNGSFTIELKDIPAGYYSGLGSIYVPPTIEFYAKGADSRTEKALMSIAETAAPFRWTGGSPDTMLPTENTEHSTGRAMFYDGRETIPLFANQEAQLRAKAYPSDMTARGWPEADDAAPWSSIPAPA